jgi:hypothetical protein
MGAAVKPPVTLALLTLLALLGGIEAGQATAQPLPDPTRPMGTARPAVPPGNVPAGTPAPARPTAPARAPAPARVVPPPQLQGLLTPEDGPRHALLDGQLRVAGQSLGRDWRLERIGDDGVLLRRLGNPADGAGLPATLWLPLLADLRPRKEP